MSYRILWEENGVKVVAEGVLDNDFLNTSIEATTDPLFTNARYAIVDFLKIDEFPVHTSTIQEIARSDSLAYKVNPDLKLAILTNKLIMTGLVNVYRSYLKLHNQDRSWDIKIFDNEAEAREWINE